MGVFRNSRSGNVNIKSPTNSNNVPAKKGRSGPHSTGAANINTPVVPEPTGKMGANGPVNRGPKGDTIKTPLSS